MTPEGSEYMWLAQLLCKKGLTPRCGVMASSSGDSMSSAFLSATKRISLAPSRLTRTDCTFPAADVPELMVVLRDFLYGLERVRTRER